MHKVVIEIEKPDEVVATLTLTARIGDMRLVRSALNESLRGRYDHNIAEINRAFDEAVRLADKQFVGLHSESGDT